MADRYGVRTQTLEHHAAGSLGRVVTFDAIGFDHRPLLCGAGAEQLGAVNDPSARAESRGSGCNAEGDATGHKPLLIKE